ncbi:MAG TPA: hypothetical protein VFG06_07735 [Thermodesulfovibrionales bacterium]|nr:hypothetical protein [Thermodesulfovibrionales bacterium]
MNLLNQEIDEYFSILFGFYAHNAHHQPTPPQTLGRKRKTAIPGRLDAVVYARHGRELMG